MRCSTLEDLGSRSRSRSIWVYPVALSLLASLAVVPVVDAQGAPPAPKGAGAGAAAGAPIADDYARFMRDRLLLPEFSDFDEPVGPTNEVRGRVNTELDKIIPWVKSQLGADGLFRYCESLEDGRTPHLRPAEKREWDVHDRLDEQRERRIDHQAPWAWYDYGLHSVVLSVMLEQGMAADDDWMVRAKQGLIKRWHKFHEIHSGDGKVERLTSSGPRLDNNVSEFSFGTHYVELATFLADFRLAVLKLPPERQKKAWSKDDTALIELLRGAVLQLRLPGTPLWQHNEFNWLHANGRRPAETKWLYRLPPGDALIEYLPHSHLHESVIGLLALHRLELAGFPAPTQVWVEIRDYYLSNPIPVAGKFRRYSKEVAARAGAPAEAGKTAAPGGPGTDGRKIDWDIEDDALWWKHRYLPAGLPHTPSSHEEWLRGRAVIDKGALPVRGRLPMQGSVAALLGLAASRHWLASRPKEAGIDQRSAEVESAIWRGLAVFRAPEQMPGVLHCSSAWLSGESCGRASSAAALINAFAFLGRHRAGQLHWYPQRVSELLKGWIGDGWTGVHPQDKRLREARWHENTLGTHALIAAADLLIVLRRQPPLDAAAPPPAGAPTTGEGKGAAGAPAEPPRKPDGGPGASSGEKSANRQREDGWE